MLIFRTLAVTFASVSTLITIASTESAYASAVGVDFHSRITILFASSYTIRMHRKTINPHLVFFALFRSEKKIITQSKGNSSTARIAEFFDVIAQLFEVEL